MDGAEELDLLEMRVLELPIVGGSSGRIVRENIRNGYNINGNSGRSKSGNGTTGGNQGGAANSYGSCTCTPASDGGMRIVSCTRAGGANKSNSLGCQNAAKGLIALVCGGRGPYTWSKTGSVVLSGTTGTNITVTPPTNSGSGVAGTAYKKYGGRCDSGGGAPVDCAGATWLQNRAASYDCNDTLTSACGTVSTTVAANSCVTAPINIGSNACASVSPCHDGATCTYGTCDNRSALMISGGCNPCGVQAGATVTVTDATGDFCHHSSGIIMACFLLRGPAGDRWIAEQQSYHKLPGEEIVPGMIDWFCGPNQPGPGASDRLGALQVQEVLQLRPARHIRRNLTRH